MTRGKGMRGDEIEITVPCRPEYVRTIRRTLTDFAESMEMPHAAVEEMQVAASEAVTNIIEHAYTSFSNAPPLCVRFSGRKDGLLVEIEDHGGGFMLSSNNLPLEACIEREGGMGITLIRTLMDSVKYDSSPSHGTRIRMMKFARPGRERTRATIESRAF